MVEIKKKSIFNKLFLNLSAITKTGPFTNRKTTTNILIVLLAIAAITAGIFGIRYYQVKKQFTTLSSSVSAQAVAQKQTQELLAKVGKLIRLPVGEEPTIATVVNVEILSKEQPFYKNANNGDRLLVYTKAQKAIIYDPVNNILVNVGPVYFNQTQTSTTATVTKEK